MAGVAAAVCQLRRQFDVAARRHHFGRTLFVTSAVLVIGTIMMIYRNSGYGDPRNHAGMLLDLDFCKS